MEESIRILIRPMEDYQSIVDGICLFFIHLFSRTMIVFVILPILTAYLFDFLCSICGFI